MQVVGRPCEICTRVIKSKLDGVGCLACERFFHDACVLAPRVEVAESASDTYRTPVAQPKKPAKRARKVRCPSCGADVRKEERERDHLVAVQREEHEERRRVKEATRDRSGVRTIWLLRVGIAFFFCLLCLIARLFAP